MGRFLSYMKMLSEENKYKEVTIKLGDYSYKVQIMDPTHLRFNAEKKPGSGEYSENWSIPQHFNQVGEDMMKELKEKGLVKGNFFVTDKE